MPRQFRKIEHPTPLIVVIILLAAFVAITWPLVTRLDHGIPRGKESSTTVPVFNLWTVGWNLDRASHGWQSYWNAPHFHPTEKTLALSEPLAATQVMLGVGWLPPPVAYNLFLLSALALNVGLTWLVLRQRRVGWPVALLASLVMLRLPFVHWQIGLLQAVLVAGLMGTIHFADEAARTGRLSNFLLAAVCFDVTFLTCGYYALFLVLLGPVWGGVLVWQRRLIFRGQALRKFGIGRSANSEFPKCLTPAWGILGALLILSAIAPLVAVQSGVLSDPFFERRRDFIQELSALPTDYLEAPFPEWFQFLGLARWHEAGRWKLSPGVFKVVLAMLGVVVGLRSRRRRAWTLIWLALVLSAFAGSLGLNLRIGGWSPYATLLDWLPTLSRLRTPARMAVLVQIGVVFLAVEALHWGFRRGRVVARTSRFKPDAPASASYAYRRETHSLALRACIQNRALIALPFLNRGTLAYGVVWLAGLIAAFEVPLPKIEVIEVPPVATQRGWIDWLNQNTPRDSVIAHVPFPRGPLPRDYEAEAWSMYWGLFHQRRMVNGYSGFFPASYLELKTQMQSFPDASSFAALRSRGVGYCVVGQSFVDEQGLMEHRVAIEQWEIVFRDETAGVSIFRLCE